MSFTAEYHGPCANCGSDVKDTEVSYNGADDLEHVVCPDPTAAQRPICPGCQMELPVTGVCGECE